MSDNVRGNFLTHAVRTTNYVLFSSSRVLWCCCTNDSANEIFMDSVHVHHRQCFIGQWTRVGVAYFSTPLLFRPGGCTLQ